MPGLPLKTIIAHAKANPKKLFVINDCEACVIADLLRDPKTKSPGFCLMDAAWSGGRSKRYTLPKKMTKYMSGITDLKGRTGNTIAKALEAL